MKLVKRILAGLDFRPDTEAVLRTVSVVAKRLRSEVSLLHVIPPVSSLPLVEVYGDVPTLVELAKKESAERLAEYKARLEQEGVSVTEPAVLEGVAFDRILAHADDLDPNVILAGVGSAGAEKRICAGNDRRTPLPQVIQAGMAGQAGSARCFQAPFSVRWTSPSHLREPLEMPSFLPATSRRS